MSHHHTSGQQSVFSQSKGILSYFSSQKAFVLSFVLSRQPITARLYTLYVVYNIEDSPSIYRN
jgi:hypothetical protein